MVKDGEFCHVLALKLVKTDELTQVSIKAYESLKVTNQTP